MIECLQNSLVKLNIFLIRMISKKFSIIILLLLSTTVVFIIYQCEQWNFHLPPVRIINQSNSYLQIRNDLNNCILSFFIFHNLQSLLENVTLHMPIYRSFYSQPMRYDHIGKECTSLFYGGQERLDMEPFQSSCFYPFKITEKERQQIHTALKIIKANFEMNHLELVLTGGSFIGSWRYHGIIPYDDDIDFYIRTKDKPLIKTLFQMLSKDKTNHFVFSDTENENQHWKLGILCANEMKYSCKIEIDFFFMWEEGSELKFLEWPMSFKKSKYLPLKQRPFENILFNVPNDFEYYMMRQYQSNSSQCDFKNHAEKNTCVTKSIDCDLLKFQYPYKLVGSYQNLLIELIVHKMSVISLFIDTANIS